MRRSEAALLVLIVFFVAWVLISLTYPLAGLFIMSVVFALFLGFFVFIIAGMVYVRRK